MAEFDNLLEFMWGDLSLPIADLETAGSQDVGEHKRVDRNGARLEGTGLNPYEFDARIPFFNTIARGPQETWDDLFPNTFTKFLALLEQRETQPMQHPLFGSLNAKALTWKFTLSGEVQNGVWAQIHFRQDNGDTFVPSDTSALGDAQAAAADLDAQLGQLNPPIDTGLSADGFESFSDFMNQLSSIGDQVSLFESKVLGKIDNVIGKINKLSDSIDGAIKMTASIPGSVVKRVVTLGNSAARLVETANRLSFALTTLKAVFLSKSKTVQFYTVPKDTTLGSLASVLKNGLTDLIKLNANLIYAPVIPANSIVRYYA